MPPTMLIRYDQQVRRNPDAGPEGIVERDDRVIRCVSADWTGVSWSDLDAETVDAAISRQLEWFHGLGRAWEWKHYSGDGPADLADRLLAAGFVAEPSETLLVAEIADLELDVRLPAGVTLEPVVDAAGAALLVGVHDEVFGGDHSAIGAAVLADLDRDRRTVVAILAMAGDRAVSSGRLEFVHGTDFAGIWGGGTLPEWRGRGAFRSLVAYRAWLALDAGFRYLQVDATADSRPILNKLGFVELATTTPFVHPG